MLFQHLWAPYWRMCERTSNNCNFLWIHANHYVTCLFLFFIVLNVMYSHNTRHFQILRFELGNIVWRSQIYQITLKHCHDHLHDPLVHSSHIGAIGGAIYNSGTRQTLSASAVPVSVLQYLPVFHHRRICTLWGKQICNKTSSSTVHAP